jgi:hypothetical protein
LWSNPFGIAPVFETATAWSASLGVELLAAIGSFDNVLRENAQVIGQVLEIKTHPRDLLDSVRTAGQSVSWTNYTHKMPGSATQGLPDSLTFAQGANKTVVINIIRK